MKLLIPDEEEEGLEFEKDDAKFEKEISPPATPRDISPMRSHEEAPADDDDGAEPEVEPQYRHHYWPWRKVLLGGDVDAGGQGNKEPRRSDRVNLGVPPKRSGDAMMMAMTTTDPHAPQTIGEACRNYSG